MDASEIISMLGLEPLDCEGGYFRETYRCAQTIPQESLGADYPSARNVSTAIYYLITQDTFSALHKVASDEIFHFYSGSPVEMLMLFPDGTHQTLAIGSNLELGEAPQAVVSAGVWQGLRLAGDGEYALMGTTVAPGFEYDDFTLGGREELIAQYPNCAELIDRFVN